MVAEENNFSLYSGQGSFGHRPIKMYISLLVGYRLKIIAHNLKHKNNTLLCFVFGEPTANRNDLFVDIFGDFTIQDKN